MSTRKRKDKGALGLLGLLGKVFIKANVKVDLKEPGQKATGYDDAANDGGRVQHKNDASADGVEEPGQNGRPVYHNDDALVDGVTGEITIKPSELLPADFFTSKGCISNTLSSGCYMPHS